MSQKSVWKTMSKTDLVAFALGAALAVPLLFLFLFLIHLLGGL